MARLTAQQVTEKHARRLKGATQDIINGVDNVTTAPGQLAAAKSQKMLTNLTNAVQSGKWGRNVAKVSLEEWKSKMKNKGINRIAAGIDDAQGKTQAFFEQLLPYQDTVRAKIATMPDLTLQDNIQRMVANAEAMAKFKRT